VFPSSISAPAYAALGLLSLSACVSGVSRHEPTAAPRVFYTVTGEIALSRHEARIAALEYAAAAATATDVTLLRRAADVTAQCLQPSLTAGVAARWIALDPAATDAHRAAARAALELNEIEQSAAQFLVVLRASARGPDAEFAVLETEIAAAGNVYGARQLADRLAAYFPDSHAALRLQAFAALRADDPAAAARSFESALSAARGTGPPLLGHAAEAPPPNTPPTATARPDTAPPDTAPPDTAPSDTAPSDRAPPDTAPPVPPGEAERRELMQGLWRAQVLAGDGDAPLAQAKATVERDPTAPNRLDYTLLLLAAQQNPAARAQLALLMSDPEARPVALRLLGLLDFQDGRLDEAGVRFAELATTGKFLDDALYYLGMIAERHQDWERALRLYAQVQNGDNAVAAALRAAAILRAHGAAPAAEELLDQLTAEEPQRAPEILVARAHIYADGGDAPLAIALLDQGLREYPDGVELHYARASLAEEHGKLAAALQELKQVAALRPADPAALNAYGYTLADNHRQLGMARKLIERAHAAAPGSAAILDSLGWVLFRQGHDEQALPYLNAAYEDDHDGDVAAHLGEVLWQLGRRADAERIWSEANRGGADNHLVNATRLRLGASH
jgi:tetratricopeptide (TPR) repeat protein